jgi:hypothetical protein
MTAAGRGAPTARAMRGAAVAGVALALAVGAAAAAPVGPPPAAPVASPGRAPTSLAMRPRPVAHGGFIDDLDCSACHTSSGWQLAPAAGASGFDHDRTGFALRGAHVQVRCAGCHTGGAKPATSCEGCHRDPHQGRHDAACAECHTATAWSDTAALDQHRRTRMPLTGRHAVIDCTACHRRTGERAFSDVPADCYSCHRAEYHAIKIHPVHDGSAGSAPFSRDCGQCHRTSGWEPAIANPGALGTALRAADHDAWFVVSTGSHRTADCAACHVDRRRTQAVRCDGCHQDTALRVQHRAQVARSAGACLACHPRGAAR